MISTPRSCGVALACALLAATAHAADAPDSLTADALASKLSALQQDGTSYVRLKLDLLRGDAPKTTLQLQIKQRRTPTSTEVVYQILWPKERAAESVLLRQLGSQAVSGSLYVPPGPPRPLEASGLAQPLFGTDLSYRDVVENFFAWEHQTLAGTEAIGRVNCQILESKPGRAQASEYARVRTWVDMHRLVPMRIEKYLPSGTLARRIETTLVVTDDLGRSIPGNFKVQGTGSDASTELEGSRLRHGVNYADSVFTPEGLSELAPPRSGSGE